MPVVQDDVGKNQGFEQLRANTSAIGASQTRHAQIGDSRGQSLATPGFTSVSGDVDAHHASPFDL
jgi:hypothetical protein